MRPEKLALWLAACVPCIAYVMSASGYAYWLDSGEFVAAAVQLDIAHPPGHPLSALYGKLVSLLPLGSLSFRVALGQGFATALAGVFVCRANAAALRGMRLGPQVTWAVALFGSWLTTLTYGVWFQAVRPEVYALQTLCVAVVYDGLLQCVSDPEVPRSKSLATASLALGLALANHHLIALLLLPAFLPALWCVLGARRWRSFVTALALGGLGLSTYAYLPLRALQRPPLNLGDPSSWDNFWWVVSARVYAKNVGHDPLQPFLLRMLDVLSLWYEDLGWAALALSTLGLYLGLRLAASRSAVMVSVLVLLVDALVRAWMGPVLSNPDVLGYLAPSYLALGTLAACGLGAGIWRLRSGSHLTWSVPPRMVWLLPMSALALVPGSWARSSLAGFSATDVLDEPRLRQLPARALVVESAPQTVFRSFELDAAEGVRPDVVHVPLPFLGYPGTKRALLEQHPELSALVDAYVGAGDQLAAPSLLAAAARERPVFVELDTRVAPKLYPLLTPACLYAQVEPAASRSGAPAALQRCHDYVERWLGQESGEPETARQLLWVHYMNALQLGALADTQLARSELQRALSLKPKEQRLQLLQRELSRTERLDPSAFLRF